MRSVFCRTLLAAASNPDFVFLTGDLGYQALEPLRSAMGARFINAGVAEQNMVAVAAGLARTGMRPWVYSIAPFLYARTFEQIRNDLCLSDLPVVLVGNGGGYGYGVMGGTHHALEDYGVLLTLPQLRVFVPAFEADVEVMIKGLFSFPHPAYLRLGRSEQPKDYALPEYEPWRRLLGGGGGPTLLVTGPLAGGILGAVRDLPERQRPDLWLVSELPAQALPSQFVADLRRSGHLFTVEEHVAAGGLGQMIAAQTLRDGVAPARLTQRCAQGYPSGKYGSQKFHRQECGLDAQSIVAELRSLRE